MSRAFDITRKLINDISDGFSLSIIMIQYKINTISFNSIHHFLKSKSYDINIFHVFEFNEQKLVRNDG
jgi:hypothetical protein